MWLDAALKALLYIIYCIYTQNDFPLKHDAYIYIYMLTA